MGEHLVFPFGIRYTANLLRLLCVSKIVLIALSYRVAVCVEILSKPVSVADVEIIQKSASVSFGDNEVLDGYENFGRRYNSAIGASVYVSMHFADAQIFDYDQGKSDYKLVILAGNNETINVPFKNVSTYVVLKQRSDKPSLYTSHLAYVSHFTGEAYVEWDLYLFHYHDTNGSFASAFFPTVDGPQVSWKNHLRRAVKQVVKKYKVKQAKNIARAQKPHDGSISSKDHNNYLALREDETSESKREIEKTGDSLTVKNNEIAKRYLNEDYKDKINSVFVGVREECPYVPFNATDNLPTAQDDLVMFYLRLLRVDCIPNYPQQLGKLFEMNLVSVKDGPTVHVDRQHPLFKKQSYGEEEHLDFVSALAMEAFSKAVVHQVNSKKRNVAENFTPDRKPISGTVKTLSSFAFSLMNDARSFQKAHAIKLTDFILVTLQTHRSEMTTVMEELESCDQCTRQKEVSFNNQLQLVSLMRLIVDNLSEILNSDNTVEKIYDSFYVTHLAENNLHVENKTPFVF